MLRAKAGELAALRNLTASAKKRITPLIHLCSDVPGTFATKFPEAWNDEVAFDGLYNLERTGSTKTFTDLVTELRSNGISANPAIAYDADAKYVKAAGKFVTGSYPYLTVKTTLDDLPKVASWIASNGWAPSNVDLVIVAGSTAACGIPQFAGYVTHAIAGLPAPSAFRSVTLASSAAPKDTGALQRGRNVVPRDDWALWNAVSSKVGFALHFGDYAASHPDLQEPPGVAMSKATVSAKYTVDKDWVIIKGHSTTGMLGAPMGSQYSKHAMDLMAEPQFGKVPGCWGDQQIIAIATGSATPGNRTTWAGITANRHLSLVAQRLP